MLEFPMSTLGVGRKFLPMTGGRYLRLFHHRVTESFFDSRNLKDHPGMVYVHPCELDTDQRSMRVGLVKTLQHYMNTHSLEWKLNRLLQKFAFGSIHDIQQTPRLQVMLARNPVYIPSHMGSAWGKEKGSSEGRASLPDFASRCSAA